MIGNTRDFVVIGKGKSQLEDFMKRATDRYGLTVKNEPSPQAGYYYRSDHFSLARQGVPMLYAEGGEDLVNGGVAAGSAAAEVRMTPWLAVASVSQAGPPQMVRAIEVRG